MLLANACGETDTVLFIRVNGTTAGSIHQFAVEVDIDGETRSFNFPETKTLINLPTSFTVQVGPSYTGAANIQVEALDDLGEVIGQGMSTTSTLETGKLNTIDLLISPVVTSTRDGGTRRDAAVDAPVNNAADGAVDAASSDARDGASLDAVVPDAPVQPDAPVVIPDAAIPDAAAVDADTDAST